MKTTVTWQDVGRPEQPGNYQFTDGMISVGRTKSPFGANIFNAMFTVVAFPRPRTMASGHISYPVEDQEPRKLVAAGPGCPLP